MITFTRFLKAFYWCIAGNQVQRRRVRQECARIAASFFGDYPIGDDYKLWLEDLEFRKKFKELSPLSPYSEERKWVLREFARYTLNIPGSIAECGCYQGASAFFIAEINPDTPLHLFDSFEGLASPSKHDKPQNINCRAWERGDMSASEIIARQNLKKFSNIFFHKGWIPDKFHEVEDETFRLVHIDVDLYQATKDSLAFFFPRVVEKGVIIMDDNGFSTCPGALQATKDYLDEERINIYPLMLPTGQQIIIKN